MFYLTPLSLEGINALFSAKLIGICIYTTLNESLNIGQRVKQGRITLMTESEVRHTCVSALSSSERR